MFNGHIENFFRQMSLHHVLQMENDKFQAWEIVDETRSFSTILVDTVGLVAATRAR